MNPLQVNFAWGHYLVPPFTQLKNVDLKTLKDKEPQISFIGEAGLPFISERGMWNLTVPAGQALQFQFQYLKGNLYEGALELTVAAKYPDWLMLLRENGAFEMFFEVEDVQPCVTTSPEALDSTEQLNTLCTPVFTLMRPTILSFILKHVLEDPDDYCMGVALIKVDIL